MAQLGVLCIAGRRQFNRRHFTVAQCLVGMWILSRMYYAIKWESLRGLISCPAPEILTLRHCGYLLFWSQTRWIYSISCTRYIVKSLVGNFSPSSGSLSVCGHWLQGSQNVLDRPSLIKINWLVGLLTHNFQENKWSDQFFEGVYKLNLFHRYKADQI